MWAAVLSCALFLFHSTAADLQYSVFTTFMLKANNTQKMCILVAGAPDSTPLNIYFEHTSFSNPVAIFNETLPAGYTFKCSDVFIPSIEKASIGYLSVEVGELRERKSLVVNGIKPFCVGEMAMPTYQPGENVTCRILCLDAKFMPFSAGVSVFEVLDPNGNRLMQQKNLTTERPFWTFSYQLTDDATPGYYQMKADMSPDMSVSMNYEVRNFVLPKFQTTLSAPQTVSVLDETMIVGVAGTYTYGQSLVGKVSLSVCRKPNVWQGEETCNLKKDGECVFITENLGPDGTMNATVDLLQFQLARNGLQMNIITEAVITENQTDVQDTKTAYTWISRNMPTPVFSYEVTKNYFKKGINATGALRLHDETNKPLYNKTISLTVKNENVADCITDKDGNCPFSFDTSKYVDSQIIIEAHYSERELCYESTNRWYGSSNPQWYLTRYFSPSGSFVQIQPIVGQQNCGQTISIHVDYSLNLKAVDPNGDAKTVSFNYMISGRSEIKKQGPVDVPMNTEGKGSFSFTLAVTAEIAPTATAMVVLLLPSGEVVADTQNFQVERCFDNQVTLQFSTDKARPGSPVNLNVNAAPNSYCAIRAVDQSMNILSGGQAQSLGDDVYNTMPYPQMWGPYVEGFDLKEPDPQCINPPDILEDGLPYEVKDVSGDMSVAADFENAGIRLICSKNPQKPVVCPKPRTCPDSTEIFARDELSIPISAKVEGFSAGGGGGGAVVATVRQFFRNLWMYDETQTDSDGKASISSILPDSITEWETRAFCISASKGFGVSNGSVFITAFQPFFTEPVMPTLIVRGEQFVLKVTAYNYMNECTPIDLKLADSSQYSAALVSVENQNCICQNERTTHAWSFKALTMGKINISATAETKSDNNCPGNKGGVTYRDTVIRQLTVEAEGIKREETQSSLICTKAGPVNETINVKLPDNLVNDSARAIVTCIGDPMGISMRNLGDLAQMPAGCGEQTLSSMRSNIAVYNYLTSIDSLDEETKSKILTNLNSGYVRMLQFISRSGCVSTWSRSYNADESYCNNWLSIASYGTIMETKKIGVYVDEKLPSQMESYLMSQQNRTSGAFPSDGRSYSNIANSDYSYTAFTALQFLKAGNNVTHPVVRDAFHYLDSVSETSDDTLGQTLACNAYAMARNKEKQRVMLDILKTKTVEDEGGRSLKSIGGQISPFEYTFRRPASTDDTLKTALLLSCCLTQDELSADDLSFAATIGKWLGGNMNAHGGFCTTLDTPFSLEAMAKFQKLTYTKGATNTVTIKFGDTKVHQFTVNTDNNLLLQRADLQTVPGLYTAEVTGNGCVFCQTTLRYNIKPENMESSFNLKVWTSPATCENGDVAKFDIFCNASYIGKKDSSNMALLDVKIPSGYQPDESSLNKLTDQGKVQMYDTATKGHVIVYFNDVTSNTTSINFSVERTTNVENLKPAPVLMYSYYDKSEVAVTSFTHPCSQPLITA